MKTNEIKIENCTCGGNGIIRRTFDDTTFYEYIECETCGNSTGLVSRGFTQAVTEWNEYVEDGGWV